MSNGTFQLLKVIFTTTLGSSVANHTFYLFHCDVLIHTICIVIGLGSGYAVGNAVCSGQGQWWSKSRIETG